MKKALTTLLQAAVVFSAASCASEVGKASVHANYSPPSGKVMKLIMAAYPGHTAAEFNDVEGIAGLHDQQEFIYEKTVGVEVYGPTVGLYTGPAARTENELKQGAVVAIIEVEGSTNAMKPYERLGIKATGTQQYCVLLSSGMSGNKWDGAVVAAGGSSCPSAAYDPSVYTMKVRRSTPSATIRDYPPAVRFDEDANGPTIGVPCAAGWCEIAADLASDALDPIDTDPGVTHKVKGWHDEQRLATNDPAFGPSSARASITPVDGLADIDPDAYDDPGSGGYPIGVRVATVMVKGAPPTDPKYAKWGFTNGKSQLWIRRVTTGHQAQFVQGGSANKEPNATDWFSVSYGAHTALKPPGVARWIWNPADEGIWIACDQGCCEISEAKLTTAVVDSLRQDSVGRAQTKRPPA